MAQDLAAAEKARGLFVLGFIGWLALGVSAAIGHAEQFGHSFQMLRAMVGLFNAFVTFRFARAIGMGIVATLIHSLLAVYIMLIPFLVLRHYHRKSAAQGAVAAA